MSSLMMLTATPPERHSSFVVAPLSADGPMLRSGGNLWRWQGASAFLLGIRQVVGDDIRPVLDWYEQMGFNLLRVFPVMSIVPPKRGLPQFILTPEQVKRLCGTVNDRGITWRSRAGTTRL